MKIIRSCLPLLLAIASGCAADPAHQPADGTVLALPNVHLIDGTGLPVQRNVTIVVRNGRISEIFPAGERPIPAGATRLAVEGLYAMPGLIDSHVHLATFDRGGIMELLLRHTLEGGVTSVRDMGGNTREVIRLARRQPGSTVISPRIYFSAVVAGPRWFATYDSARIRYWSGGDAPGEAPGVRLLDSDDAITEIVEEARRLGASGLKVYSDVPPARLALLTSAAHRAGLRVWTHAVVPPARPEEIVAAGADVLSHADQVIWTAAPPTADTWSREQRGVLLGTVHPERSPALRSLFERMRQESTLFEPTLLVMQLGAPAGADRAALDTLPAWAVGAARVAHAAGVQLLAGTDAIGRETPNLHAELQLLVRQVGLTPLEAIRAATFNAALALGAQDSIGSIMPGKMADLVLLRADPTVDIRNTQTIELVLQGGRVYRRESPWQTPQGALPPPE
jgi:cytosine/adenosine deaminase-related metal-dependent hydrolase